MDVGAARGAAEGADGGYAVGVVRCRFGFSLASAGCLRGAGRGLLASATCLRTSNVAPVRGGTYFLCRRKESRQRKRAHTASPCDCPRAPNVPTLHTAMYSDAFVANASNQCITHGKHPYTTWPCRTFAVHVRRTVCRPSRRTGNQRGVRCNALRLNASVPEPVCRDNLHTVCCCWAYDIHGDWPRRESLTRVKHRLSARATSIGWQVAV
jgi:hypothetical protein